MRSDSKESSIASGLGPQSIRADSPAGSGIGVEATRKRSDRIFRDAEALRTQIIDRHPKSTTVADIYHNFPIEAPAEKVFEAISRSEGLDKWWTKGSTVNPVSGGMYILDFGPGYIWKAIATEYEKGKSLTEAALTGAHIRLRPILMTSFAFVLGCVPLWLASGSGGASRKTMGTTVIGGMLSATLLGIFIIPVAFYVVEKIVTRFSKDGQSQKESAGEDEHDRKNDH